MVRGEEIQKARGIISFFDSHLHQQLRMMWIHGVLFFSIHSMYEITLCIVCVS